MLPPDWLDPVFRFLANPLVSPLLLSLGVLGLVFEVKTGMFGIGGLISLISLGLFFVSSFMVGLGSWQEVILLGIGLVAICIEVFILPGFGAAGILGIVALFAAVMLAMIGSHPTPGDVTQAFVALGVSLVITASVTYAWRPSGWPAVYRGSPNPRSTCWTVSVDPRTSVTAPSSECATTAVEPTVWMLRGLPRVRT